MASIRARARSWQVRWREDGAAQVETFGRESDAVRFREAVEDADGRWPAGWLPGKGYGAAGADASDKGYTVARWVEAYVYGDHNAMQPHVREQAMGRVRAQLLGTPLGDARLSLVTRETVQQFTDVLAERYARNTIAATLSLLASAFKAAINEGLIVGQTPVFKIHNRGRKARKATFLTVRQEQRIIDATPERYRLFVELLFGSGLRYGEAWALFPDSVVEANGIVTVTVAHSRRDIGNGDSVLGDTKNKKTRTVALPEQLGKALLAYAEQRDPAAPLFDVSNPSLFSKVVWAAIVRNANLPDAPRVHDTRHTHASRMLAAGMTINALSKRLGHWSIQITADTYGHLSREDEATMMILNSVY